MRRVIGEIGTVLSGILVCAIMFLTIAGIAFLLNLALGPGGSALNFNTGPPDVGNNVYEYGDWP